MMSSEHIELLPVTSRMKDLTGKTFNRLTVIGYVGKSEKGSKSMWLCKCECGNNPIVESYCLTKEITKSCGCLSLEKTVARNTKHGMRNTRIYSIWKGMKNRCSTPTNVRYSSYGGRGITYDPRWKDFMNFYNDMSEGYGDDLSLDRTDVDGNYCKENCKWIPIGDQQSNKRTNVLVVYQGEEYKLIDLYNKIKPDMSYNLLYNRIATKGWDVEIALHTKVDTKKRNKLTKEVQ